MEKQADEKSKAFNDTAHCVRLCADYCDWHAAAVPAVCHEERGDKSFDVAVYGDLGDVCDGLGRGGHVSELDVVWAACHSLPDSGRRAWVYDNRRVYFGAAKAPDWLAGAGDAA